MRAAIELLIGLSIWITVLWDGFATIVLPRTVAPLKRISGRFNQLSWWLWSAAARRIRSPGLHWSFLSVYGPLSVMLLLLLWAGLVVFAFALMYHALGERFQASVGPVDFLTLLYMSGSTFLTLGIGDVTSPDSLGRFFIIVEAGTGFVFLGLIITYMPLLDQAYSSREVENLLIHSRAGRPPSAIKLLHRYAGVDRSDLLRANIREAERWMAEILQSHLCHPVLAFYRAQHFGRSWLVALITILDSCSLLIAAGSGLPALQAKLTYRMGLRLLKGLVEAMSIPLETPAEPRLTEADLPALSEALKNLGIPLTLEPLSCTALLRLVQRYDHYVQSLAHWLLVPLPVWIAHNERDPIGEGADGSETWIE